ncbi:hypothetical protein [Foetidibacter luteolus]|uniref:hypothetical protein n=1 Tax=Foetidibacter luteolus TaxID=2608880 RepID=UPI00129AFB68|nr:hypothetical protein [Foetidibacter luteolus]
MSSREYDYIVTLQKTDPRLFDYLGRLMLFFSFVSFAYNGIVSSGKTAIFYFALCTLIVITFLVFRIIRKGPPAFSTPLMVAAVGWFYEPGYYKWLGLLFIVAAIMEKQVKLPREIGVDNEGVTINNFPIKRYGWPQLANVVLKDGLLTIDYKNNKIFQRELESHVSPELEQEFNEFCRARLQQAKAVQTGS